jgi:cytochrome b pre-mRNA-processing protein 3
MAALDTVRLERGGEGARRESVAVAEGFVGAMDAEHRELGIGDPTLGRKVRKLVGALARRVELWRDAIDGERWDEAVKASLNATNADALAHCEAALHQVWAKFEAASDAALAEGAIG